MIQGSVSINDALGILSRQTRSRPFRRFLIDARKRVERGTSLSEVFALKEKEFGSVFVNFIRAGEASGSLVKNLSTIADWMERDYDLRREVKSATLYPKFILATAIILGMGLTVFVLPRLLPMFEQLDIVLPLSTKILMGISLFVQNHAWAVVLGFLAVLAFFFGLNKIRPVKKFFHAVALRSPYFGPMLKEYQLALVSHLFATLFESGITINESLQIAQRSISNLCYRDSLEHMRRRVQKGTSLSEALGDYGHLYPNVFYSLVLVGEKSGSLHESFAHLAEFYSKQVQVKAKRLPVIIEPVLLVAIGLVVLFVGVAIISPIYELTAGVGG